MFLVNEEPSGEIKSENSLTEIWMGTFAQQRNYESICYSSSISRLSENGMKVISPLTKSTDGLPAQNSNFILLLLCIIN